MIMKWIVLIVTVMAMGHAHGAYRIGTVEQVLMGALDGKGRWLILGSPETGDSFPSNIWRPTGKAFASIRDP